MTSTSEQSREFSRSDPAPPSGAPRAALALSAVGATWLIVIVTLFLVRSLEAWVPEGVPRQLPLAFDDPSCTWTSLESGRASPDDPWAYHGSDGGRVGRCVTAPIELGSEPTLAVRYGGDPGDRLVHITLEATSGDAASWPLVLPARALHVWTTAFVEVPEEARGRAVRLVIDDRSTGAHGAVRMRALATVEGRVRSHGGLLLPRRLVTVVVASFLALAWLFWAVDRRTTWILVVAGVLTQFLQAATFYHRDDWGLIERLSAGPPASYFVGYYQQFEPLVISLYAGLVSALRQAYAPQQLVIVVAHAGVVLLLVRVLRRHGVGDAVSLAVGLVYGVVWTHADVAPWLIELFYVASTAFTLLALDSAISYCRGDGRALVRATLACVVATCSFIGGIVAFPLAAAYVFAFGEHGRRRRAVASLTVAAAVTLAVAVIAMPLGGAVSDTVTGLDRLLLMARYLARGVVDGSVAPFLAAGNLEVGRALAGALGAAALAAVASPRAGSRLRRGVGFGLVWLVATYALQAVTRWQQGAFQATSFRYSHFGMTAVAFLLAILLDRALAARGVDVGGRGLSTRRAGVAVVVAVVIGMQVTAYVRRIDAHEREYYVLSRIHYELTAAQLRLAHRGLALEPRGQVPRSLATNLDWGRYVRVASWLAREDAGGGPREGARDGWNPFLD